MGPTVASGPRTAVGQPVDRGARSAVHPVVGAPPPGVGVLAGSRGVLAGRRVRAEELHRALLGVQRPQRVGHQLVAEWASA